MEKGLAFRLLMVPLLLYCFYALGMPVEALVVLGALFIALIVLRGKVWKAAEHVIERYLPFTRTWPGWAQKALIFLLFVLVYMVLKQVVYLLLGLVGVDLEGIIISAYDMNSAVGVG